MAAADEGTEAEHMENSQIRLSPFFSSGMFTEGKRAGNGTLSCDEPDASS